MFYQSVLLVALNLNRISKLHGPASRKPVSVVICANNEAENLRKNLPVLLRQQHPDFEIIVVDDGSDDDTGKLDIKDERLKIIRLPKEEKIGLGKKYALQKGVEQAKHQVILLTDADCRPLSETWISEMAGKINETHKIVLGISPHSTEINFLNGLIEYETAQTALQYTGWAVLGNPYMSVGRNVAYDAALIKKKVWTENELAVASGDDDLAIQALANAHNTAVCLSREGYTVSDAKNSWSAWVNQKLRHYESGALYKLSQRIILGGYLLTKLFIYVSIVYFFVQAVFSAGYSSFLVFPFAAYIIYVCLMVLLNLILHRLFRLNSRWYLAGLYDPIYVVFTVFLGIISLFKPKRNWN